MSSTSAPRLATPSATARDSGGDESRKVVFQGPYEDVDLPSVPALFRPRTGPFQLVDHEKVYAVDSSHDVFAERGIRGSGALVVVRPDQYVAHVLPLTARDELTGFFERTMFPRAVAEPLAQT